MTTLRYIQSTEPVAGAGGSFTDTLNRALRDLLTASGYNPDAAIVGQVALPPGGGRTVTNLTTYLANNAPVNPKDYGATGDGATNDTVAINAAIAVAAAMTPPGTVSLPPNATCVVTSITNPNGVPIVGPGKIVKSLGGGDYQQLNTYGDLHQRIYGREYLAAFHNALIAKSPTSVVMTGTSTTSGGAGTSVDANYVGKAILDRLAAANGVLNHTIYNRGQSGQNTTFWIATSLAGDLTANAGGPPTLMIIRWGENDVLLSPSAFIANMRTALTTIRAAAPLSSMSILLMSPAGMAQAATGRNEAWGEALNIGLRQLARDFQCAYYDTYATFRDARTLTNIGWDVFSVHPGNAINAATYTDVASIIYPKAIVGLTGLAPTEVKPALLNSWALFLTDTRHVSLGRSTAAFQVTTPDSVAASITGDIDIRVQVALDSYTTGVIQNLVSKLHTDGQSSYDFSVSGTGALNYRWTSNGSFASINQKVSTALLGLAGGTQKWLRVTHSVNNGSSGNDVKFYTSPDGTTWTQLGTTVTTAGITSIFDGTDHLELGASLNGGGLPMKGVIYRADVLSGIAGTLKVTFNPAASSTDGATSLTATTGEVWTLIECLVYERLVRATKLADSTVRLRGKIKSGTTTTGTVVLNLPTGYTPLDEATFACATDTANQTATLYITEGGVVTILAAPSSGFISLDGIAFKAA